MSKRFVVLTAILTLALAGSVRAEEAAVEAAAVEAVEAVAAEAVEAVAAVEVNNKICPVGGEEIGSMGEPGTIEYNGKVFKTCCAGCAEKFTANPEAYLESLAKAEAEAVVAAEGAALEAPAAAEGI